MMIIIAVLQQTIPVAVDEDDDDDDGRGDTVGGGREKAPSLMRCRGWTLESRARTKRARSAKISPVQRPKNHISRLFYGR
jgi:hypothetical protein